MSELALDRRSEPCSTGEGAREGDTITFTSIVVV